MAHYPTAYIDRSYEDAIFFRADAIRLILAKMAQYEIQLKNNLESNLVDVNDDVLRHFLAETFHQYGHYTRADPGNLAMVRDVLMQIFQEDDEYELIMFTR